MKKHIFHTGLIVSGGLHNLGQNSDTEDADIEAPEAWNLITDANDIIVAVLDSGIDYTQPDLMQNIWVNTAELNGNPNNFL